MFGCSATVPKEVVELSYKMEKDMVEVQSTYISLVKQHIGLLKLQRENYLKNEWIPLYVKSWIDDGQLIGMADGSVEYDEEADEFKSVTTPTPNRQAQLNGVVLWAEAAVSVIDEKRLSLIKPLELAEVELIDSINQSFSLLLRGNKTITAHLNSIREVQDVQNDLLSKVELGGLRDKLNTQLSQLSDDATNGLEKIRKIDQKTKKYTEK
tara:strand:+ start:5135 stop:5764 length:630 start_codon:yes stop_codon:yes gene_type:complete